MTDQTQQGPNATAPAAVNARFEYRLRVDCVKNGCTPHHGDHGLTVVHTDTGEPDQTVNNHATTLERRAVVESGWDAVTDETDPAEVVGALLAAETCDMRTGDPFDFAWCATHDTTFPLGGVCKFNGKVAWEVYAEEADEQRGRAVSAEMRAEWAQETAAMAAAQLAELIADAPSAVLEDGSTGPAVPTTQLAGLLEQLQAAASNS